MSPRLNVRNGWKADVSELAGALMRLLTDTTQIIHTRVDDCSSAPEKWTTFLTYGSHASGFIACVAPFVLKQVT
jgi:hypothetical protein